MQYHRSVSHIQPSIIYDDQGRPVGVVVPYADWLKTQKQPPAKAKERAAKRAFRAGDLKGKLRWPIDPVEFQRQAREECPR